MENSYEKATTQSFANSLTEKPIQNKAITLQDNRPASILQRKANNTGLPDNLKSGIENLSGHSMDDVKVHYNSDKPAQLNAHAYAQGTDIHIASGQEKHLPHEAWHVVQQKQGRVKPTLQMKGKVNVNDDKGLESEADIMGTKALNYSNKQIVPAHTPIQKKTAPIQLKKIDVSITGITHLVQMIKGSIMEGEEAYELSHGDQITIDSDIKYRSRRGPNHELYEHVDKKSEHIYRWFRVLSIRGQNVANQNLYIRDETFETIAKGTTVSTKPAKISDSHRLRDMNPQTFDYDMKGSRKRNPSKIEIVREQTNKIIEDATRMKHEQADHFKEGLAVTENIALFTNMVGRVLGGTFISIIYGSYATGNQRKATNEKPGSDIDAMFSCDNQTYVNYRNDLLPIISSFLKELHALVGATVDDEVPGESKHLISANEMMKASSGKVFYPQGEHNNPTIHSLGFFLEKVITEDSSKTKTESQRFGKDFLASEYLRLRLIFNILSSKNIISSNNAAAIKTLEMSWKESLHKLSDDLQRLGNDRGENGVEHLLKDKDGNDGEMFLGYKRDRMGVIKHLQEILNERL
ncbi:eCIS core domain-containing protein [Flavobacterium sp. KACC 22763]|uniref:eCIS core domain-containing protein n=1 Tax=Flavobacterium sp. KACC 22763 TaxID=3025668 RepID=UPI0023653269|nr:DUF4157 domain-containing protein [Flavobacterium sp. KACC 22763]WDF65958.1 DUF4157 domain-containing protein [Flavobacterium sp. KACC 22763]